MPRRHILWHRQIPRPSRLAVLLPCLTALLYPAGVGAQPLTLPTFAAMAQKCGSGVATLTLAAVARTESRFEPLVVGDNSTRRSYSGKSLEEAEATADRLMAAGDNLDLGLMQINSNNLKRLGLTVRGALDPCRSIASAASILTHNFLSAHGALDNQTALRNALSMYNTGNALRGYRNGYVGRVEAAAHLLAATMVASGNTAAADRSTTGPAQIDLPSWDVWAASPQPHASAAPDGAPDPIFVI